MQFSRYATRLCDAQLATLGLYDGEKFEPLAQRGGTPDFVHRLFSRGPYVPVPGSNMWQTMQAKRPIHIDDVTRTPRVTGSPAVMRDTGAKTLLSVPMLKEGQFVGHIGIYRREIKPFTQTQIDLVSTFANQAVIAIENVRLFKELQARNAELRESLEQQTATAEILRVISSSPTNIQPVLDAVAESAARLCAAPDCVIRLVDGETHRAVAHYGPNRARRTSRSQPRHGCGPRHARAPNDTGPRRAERDPGRQRNVPAACALSSRCRSCVNESP